MLQERWLLQVSPFAAQHGRLPRRKGGKPSPLVAGEQQLGDWCKYQRQQRKGSKHGSDEWTAEQVAALEAIPGWF